MTDSLDPSTVAVDTGTKRVSVNGTDVGLIAEEGLKIDLALDGSDITRVTLTLLVGTLTVTGP